MYYLIDLTRKYIDVNLPKEWQPFLDEALANLKIQKQLESKSFSRTYSGLGRLITRMFLVENTSFRFQHINTDDRHITIQDNKINHVFDVHIKENPNELWCEYCDSTECEHIPFCYTIPEVKKVLKKKGWELPQP